MKHSKICLVVFVFVCQLLVAETSSSALASSSPSSVVIPASQNGSKPFPDFEPLFTLDQVLGTEDTGATLTADELFKLSLLFSECPLESKTAARCLKKFEKMKADLKRSSYMDLPPEERGRAVLKYLYSDYLTKYDFDQTKVDVALEKGTYNCVSSALLYMVAAKLCGLEVRGQKTTQHAFCSIYVPNSATAQAGQNKNLGQLVQQGQSKKIDVETTNPYGFNPGSRETIENEAKIKQYYVVPKKYYSNRMEVSDLVFAGLIAGNICSDCIKSGDYVRAVPIGAARYEAVRLEKSKAVEDVRQNLDILAVNYVNLNMESAAVLSDILDWYTSFIDRWGMTDFLQKNMDNAFNNLLILCTREKNYQLAAFVYQKNEKYLSQKQISKSEEMLADILFASAIKDVPYEMQIEIIQEMLSSEDYETVVLQKRGQLYLENAWLNTLNDLMNLRDYQTGLHKCDEALTQLPQSSKIKNMRQYFYSNCIAIIHNEFAKKANKQYFEGAIEVLNKGLEQFPDDATLKKDLADLMKVMGI